MQIHPLRPTPLAYGPRVADLRHRRPDRRVQAQGTAHRDAGFALCAVEGGPEEVGDGRAAGDEGCDGGDCGGGGGVLLLFVVVVGAAGGLWWFDCCCDGWDRGGFVVEAGRGVFALFCGTGVVGWLGEGVADAAAWAEGLVALASGLLRYVGRFGEGFVAGDEDCDLGFDAGSTELGEGAG